MLEPKNPHLFFVMCFRFVVNVTMTVNQFYLNYYHLHLTILNSVRAKCKGKLEAGTERFHSISDKLFHYVVDKCYPIRNAVCRSVLNIIVLSFFAFTGLGILREVNLTDQISDAARVIIALVISFAGPILNNTIRSRTYVEIREKDL